jgi:hypothetical protein
MVETSASDCVVDCTDEASNPGGRDAVELEGAMKSSVLRAPELIEDSANGVREIVLEATPAPERKSSDWQLPLDEGEEGHTTVGEEGGSSVTGGVRVALELLLLEPGEAERARCRPLGPAASRSPASPTPTIVPASS